MIDIVVEERATRDLVETDCSTILKTLEVLEEWHGVNSVKIVDGTEIGCRGSSDIEMVVRGTRFRLQTIMINGGGGWNRCNDGDGRSYRFGRCHGQ